MSPRRSEVWLGSTATVLARRGLGTWGWEEGGFPQAGRSGRRLNDRAMFRNECQTGTSDTALPGTLISS